MRAVAVLHALEATTMERSLPTSVESWRLPNLLYKPIAPRVAFLESEPGSPNEQVESYCTLAIQRYDYIPTYIT